jgi:hypothetical protein
MSEEKETGPLTNKKFAVKDELFAQCCELANLPKTGRQASKFRMGLGKAFGFKNQVKNDLQNQNENKENS